MKETRQNEGRGRWLRSERVFKSGPCNWYLQTREGVNVGPYASQFEAEVEAGLLKEILRGMSADEDVLDLIRDFVRDSYDAGRPLNPNMSKEETVAS